MDRIVPNMNIARQLRTSMRGAISAIVILTAFSAAALTSSCAVAQVAVAGSLVADMRPSQLSGANNTLWANLAPAATSVGDFHRADNGAITVSPISGTVNGNPITTNALAITSTAANALISNLQTPASITGNANRTVEAWVLPPDSTGTQGVLSYGVRGTSNSMARFSYNGGNFGMISGWFNDSTWTGPLPTADFVHVVWTYEGATRTAKGYLNGVLNTTFQHPADLTTPASLMYLGTAPGGTNDPFHGYIAEVRVHTGILNDVQVLNNYSIGIEAPIVKACDFNGDNACNSADFTILTNHLFTNGGKSSGDFNLDGVIDLKDLRAFKDHPDRVVGGAGFGSLASIPEPTSIMTVVLACLCIVPGLRRRAD